MTTALETAIETFSTDLGLAHDIVHGDDTTVVTTDGGDVNSLAKTIAEAEATAAAIIAPSTAAAVAAQAGAEAAQTAAEAAQTASEAAEGTAVAAAGSAGDAQTAAEAAQTGAETAQGLAEGARDDAVTAQTASEAAQTASETARDQAQEIVGETISDLGAGTEIDLGLGASWFKKTFAAGAVAMTVTNWKAAGTISSFVLEAKNLGLATPTWPASWHWAADVEPVFSDSATDLISVMSGDGGVTVYAGVGLFGLNPGA